MNEEQEKKIILLHAKLRDRKKGVDQVKGVGVPEVTSLARWTKG